MAWMVKYDKLDDDQKDFVDKEINNTGNIWIQGFAGSGKSVMLIHALRKKIDKNLIVAAENNRYTGKRSAISQNFEPEHKKQNTNDSHKFHSQANLLSKDERAIPNA